MKVLTEFNSRQQQQAASRWRLILEFAKMGMGPSEIGRKLRVSRARASQLVKKARLYFGDNDQNQPK